MAHTPLGERVTALETKFPFITERLERTATNLESCAGEVESLRKELERLTKLARPALWLASAMVLHLSGGNVAKLLAISWKALTAGL